MRDRSRFIFLEIVSRCISYCSLFETDNSSVAGSRDVTGIYSHALGGFVARLRELMRIQEHVIRPSEASAALRIAFNELPLRRYLSSIEILLHSDSPILRFLEQLLIHPWHQWLIR
jgi:hypothetical protein